MSAAEEARRLLAAATPGPWVHVPPGQDGTVHRIEHQVGPGSPRLARMEDTGYSERSSWDQRGRDAELIAAAPTLIADLLAERDALAARVATAVAELDAEHHPMWSAPGVGKGYTVEPVDGKEPVGCTICFPGDGSWPCVSRMIANDIRIAANPDNRSEP